ncbi:MAG: methyltransferase domain-containing protein [Ketobacteraceae bacterium]|nr:methyltransferase domain-containing protein [Ketobacteraceae bacterium]
MSDTDLSADRNFDDLAERFSRRIHNSLKGRIRVAVVQRDLRETIPGLGENSATDKLRILDAGGGPGGFAVLLAEQGHDLVYCDISGKMLALAREQARQAGVEESVRFYQEPVQTLLEKDRDFQVILFHAVLEWLAKPREVLDQIISVMPGGARLSLLFYNERSIVFRNLLRGNFYRATSSDQRGHEGSLTPSHPLDPDDVKGWLQAHPVSICCESGVRTFYDYGERNRLDQRTPEQIIEMEKRFSRQSPYRDLARYYHIIIQKNRGPR